MKNIKKYNEFSTNETSGFEEGSFEESEFEFIDGDIDPLDVISKVLSYHIEDNVDNNVNEIAKELIDALNNAGFDITEL